MAIGEILTSLMRLRNTNPNQLSKVTGVNVNTIYGIIRRNNKKVDLDDLKAICKALGVTLDYFSENDDYVPSPELVAPDTQTTLAMQRINNLCSELNDEGQAKVEDYAQDLVDSGKYKKGIPDANNGEKSQAV